MNIDGLDVVLYNLNHELETARAEAAEEVEQAQLTSNRLDEIQTRIQALQSCFPISMSRPQPSTKTPALPEVRTVVSRPVTQDWESLCSEAERRLAVRGVDPNTISLDTLLDAEEVTSIERRFRGEFTLSARLDGYDVAAAAVAGLVAGLVDFFIAKIPKDITYLGEYTQSGSPVTKWLHSLSIPSDNWLAHHFKTSYDTVKPVMSEIPGFSPKTHRLQTPGHDPLVGLVIGTIDIMRGGLTAVSKSGEVIILNNTGAAHYNPFTAMVWQIMHLISDGFTKMGLPLPGWSLLQLLQVGNFGEKERTVADLARFMYLKGYDSRHFMTMSTSVAAAEAVLRSYFWLRRKIDASYGLECNHVAEVIGTQRTSAHPRFQAMALAAHATASAINVGKVVIYQGNPLAINYAQWLRFFHSVFKFVQTKMRSPSEVLTGYGNANMRMLTEGWPKIDVTGPEFPTLIVP